MLTEQQLNQIDNIMDNFDFHKVYKVMKYLNWEWYNSKIEMTLIPNECDIRIHAREMLKSLFEKELCSVECGGFRATKYDEFVKLEFIITSCESYNELWYT